MKYSAILFDLDGTIHDSRESILSSLRHAYRTLGLAVPTDETLNRYLGPPLLDGFMENAKLDEERAKEACRIFRAYYRAGAMYECTTYDGMIDLLKHLKQAKIPAAVASCKLDPFVKAIAEKRGYLPYFAAAVGASEDGRISTKAEVIGQALAELNLPPEKVLMVGDRKDDILGAKEVGALSAGALWGFSLPGELKEAGADFLFETPKALEEFLFMK